MTKFKDFVPGSISELPEGINLVKFYTSSCQACKVLSKQFESKEDDEALEGVNLFSVNLHENIDWITDLGIKTVPTTVGFIDQQKKFSVSGANISEILTNIKENLKD